MQANLQFWRLGSQKVQSVRRSYSGSTNLLLEFGVVSRCNGAVHTVDPWLLLRVPTLVLTTTTQKTESQSARNLKMGGH